MTTRDLLEYILEAIEENKLTEEKLTTLFNKVYADRLAKPKGKWTVTGEGVFDTKYHCSACGQWNGYGRTAFCPRCGAEMKRGNDNE